MKKYIAYIENWDFIIENAEKIGLKWVFVDGSQGLCIFENDLFFDQIKEVIDLDKTSELIEVHDWWVKENDMPWNFKNTPELSGETFYHLAIQYPKGAEKDWEYKGPTAWWKVKEKII